MKMKNLKKNEKKSAIEKVIYLINGKLDKFHDKFCAFCYHNPNLIFTREICKLVYGLDICYDVKIPESSRFVHHGIGCCIGKGVKIGEGVNIFQNVTIGSNFKSNENPEIEDNVVICSNSVIVGDIKVGKNSIIGACSFIDRDIPENSIAYNKREIVIKDR